MTSRPITDILGELIDLATQVWETWDAPNPAPRSDRTIRGMPGSRPPTNLQALDLLRTDPLDGLTIGHGAADSHLLDRLSMCVRMIAEERTQAGMTTPAERYGDWSSVTDYLLSTASWWQSEPGLADDIDTEIRRVHRALEQAARVPHDPVYRCDCGGQLAPQPGGMWMECADCRKQVPGLGRIREQLRTAKPMTAEALEREYGESLGVRRDTIRKWASRGLVESIGTVRIRGRDTHLYSPWDVLQITWQNSGIVA